MPWSVWNNGCRSIQKVSGPMTCGVLHVRRQTRKIRRLRTMSTFWIGNPTATPFVGACARYLSISIDREGPAHALYLTRHEPARPEGWVLLARCYFEQGQNEEAGKTIEKVLQQHPEIWTPSFGEGSSPFATSAMPRPSPGCKRCWRRFRPTPSLWNTGIAA